MRKCATAALLFVVFSVVAGAQSTQQAQQNAAFSSTPSTQNTIQVNVNVVNVLATVTDKKGHIVLDLGQKDFRLFEDNQPQTIQYFSRETDLPLRVGILIDTSNSVRERLHFEQEAAVDFLNQALRPGEDQAFVLGFDVEPQIVQDYTDDVDKLATAIRSLQAGGTTALYDAIYYACRQKMLIEPQPQPYIRRVLIIVSDGRDNESQHSREEALAMARRSEAVIYTISTNNSGSSATEDTVHGSGNPGDKVLRYFAQESGGRVFFPFEATDLASNFQDIARELRSQYSLGYVSSNQKHDGSFRAIAVETTEKGFRVRAKTGYFAQSQ
jgi:Ca-activated chloride channel homolog